MPNDFFRWADGGALIHHCPHCQQPLTNPRSRGKCLGHHVEWCHRYHTQLFKKGGSSSCMACRNSDEQSEQRHRAIAELILKLSELETEPTSRPPRTPLSKREEPASVSTSGSKKDRKAAKKAAKAFSRPKIVTSKEVQQVREVLHPSINDDEEFEKALIEDENINANLYYHSGTANSREMRQIFIKQERSGKGGLIVEKAELDRILSELNVPPSDEAISKPARAIVAAVVRAVEEDLVHVHNEDKLVMQRKAGFWRWASRKAYDRLIANNRIWEEKSEANSFPSGSEVVESAADDAKTQPVMPAVRREVTGDSANESSDLAHNPTDTDLSRQNSTSTSGGTRNPSNGSKYSTDRTSIDSGKDLSWTAVGKAKPKVQTKPAGLKLKMNLNGGINHLLSKPSPKTPKYSSFASMAAGSGYEDDDSDYGYDELSPLTALYGRRFSLE